MNGSARIVPGRVTFAYPMIALALFTLCFLTLQSAPPTSGSSVIAPTASLQAAPQKHTKQARRRGPTLIETIRAEIARSEGERHEQVPPGGNIVVSRLPAVTIAKAGIDWATLANYLLFLIGLFGIGTALRTLRYLKQQLAEMTLQRQAMGEQNRISMSKERARLGVRVQATNIPITNVGWEVKFIVENVGFTHAFSVSACVAFASTESPIPPPIQSLNYVQQFSMIGPGKRKLVDGGPMLLDEGGTETWSFRTMEAIDADKLFLHVRGEVGYQDVFGKDHLAPFRFIWSADNEAVTWGQEREPRWFPASHFSDPKES